MEKVVYNEDTVFNIPTGAALHNHVQGLRDELDRMEVERDNAMDLLREIAEVEDEGDLEDVISKIKNFVDNDPFRSYEF